MKTRMFILLAALMLAAVTTAPAAVATNASRLDITVNLLWWAFECQLVLHCSHCGNITTRQELAAAVAINRRLQRSSSCRAK